MAQQIVLGDSTTFSLPILHSDLGGTLPSGALPGGAPTGSGSVVMAASPALTGSPTAPTPATNDNSTLLATTAYVKAQPLAGAISTVFGRTGAVVAASNDYAVAQITGAAPLASPTLTGTPAAPTAAANTNTTQLATTAFVVGQNYAQRVATVDLTGQVATLTAQTLLAAGAVITGMYRLTGWIKKTTAATTSSTTGPLTITFTDGTDSTSLTPTMALLTSAGAIATSNATNAVLVTAANTIVPFTFFAKVGVAITYTFTYASSGATAMQYEIHLRLEQVP